MSVYNTYLKPNYEPIIPETAKNDTVSAAEDISTADTVSEDKPNYEPIIPETAKNDTVSAAEDISTADTVSEDKPKKDKRASKKG